jgi:hypothetical protein
MRRPAVWVYGTDILAKCSSLIRLAWTAAIPGAWRFSARAFSPACPLDPLRKASHSKGHL